MKQRDNDITTSENTMLLSVIIPTYNRAGILENCLESLQHQTLPREDFEIIVSDDGSTDCTQKVVERYRKRNPYILYLRQKNQGQGIARNNALQHAKGNIIVLIGDDIVVTPEFLQEHLRVHLQKNAEHEAVLGLTAWYPHKPVNDFMRWMTNGSSIFGRFGGHQFAYEKLQGKTEADYNFFYTSNISLKRSLFEKYSFDPTFSGYGWEDIELGYRLHKYERLRLYYNPKALAYHDHFQDEKSLAPRMRSIGSSAWIFERKHPELRRIPRGIKYVLLWSISRSPIIMLSKIFSKTFYYYVLSKKYFLEGLKEGRKREEDFLRAKLDEETG